MEKSLTKLNTVLENLHLVEREGVKEELGASLVTQTNKLFIVSGSGQFLEEGNRYSLPYLGGLHGQRVWQSTVHGLTKKLVMTKQLTFKEEQKGMTLGICKMADVITTSVRLLNVNS